MLKSKASCKLLDGDQVPGNLGLLQPQQSLKSPQQETRKVVLEQPIPTQSCFKIVAFTTVEPPI